MNQILRQVSNEYPFKSGYTPEKKRVKASAKPHAAVWSSQPITEFLSYVKDVTGAPRVNSSGEYCSSVGSQTSVNAIVTMGDA